MFKHSLARDIAIILALKMSLIIAAGVFVFGPKQRPAIDAQSVQEHLLDDPVFTRNRSGRQ